MLWETLSKELVFSDLDVSKRDDVFETMGSKLVGLGYCKSTYIEALKNRELIFPTGLDVNGIGVAIPHTDPEHVEKNAVAIAKLKNKVDFIAMATDPKDNITVPVSVVFMLAVSGGKHIEFLQRVILLLQNQQALSQLVNASGPEEIINIIRKGEMENENL